MLTFQNVKFFLFVLGNFNQKINPIQFLQSLSIAHEPVPETINKIQAKPESTRSFSSNQLETRNGRTEAKMAKHCVYHRLKLKDNKNFFG